jgi:hypothetical protein
LGEHVKIADGVPVGGETEEDVAVVGGSSYGQHVTD